MHDASSTPHNESRRRIVIALGNLMVLTACGGGGGGSDSGSGSGSSSGSSSSAGSSASSSSSSTGSVGLLSYTNHWAGNTGGLGNGSVSGSDAISNFVVDLAVLKKADLSDQWWSYAPMVITKSYWDETNWGDGAYSAGKRVSKGEYWNSSITFDSSTYNGITATIAHPSTVDTTQQGYEDQGLPLTGYSSNLPYVSLSDGRSITSVDYPTGVAFDSSGRLWVADNGADQNFKIFTVGSSGAPTLSTTFGEIGGVFGGTTKGLAGDKRFWGPRGVGFGDGGEIVVGTSGIPGQTQGGTDIRWFDSTGTTMTARAISTFVHVADIDPSSSTGANLYSSSVRYRMDYSQTPGNSWALAAVTLDPFRFPDDPRLFMPLETAYVRVISGKKFLFCTSMAGLYLAVFRIEDSSEIAIPCAFLGLYSNGQSATWASGKYPTWDTSDSSNSARRYMWRDSSGDGSVLSSEFSQFYLPNPYSQAIDIDDNGNIWIGGGLAEYSSYYGAGGVLLIPCDGIDSNGVPIYSTSTFKHLDIPSSLLLSEDNEISRAPTRLRYLADSDTLVLGAGNTWYTQRVYVIDGFMNSGSPTRRCVIDPGYSDNGESSINLDVNTSTMVLPFSFAADADYLYVVYLDNGLDAKVRGEVTIYSLTTGAKVGWIKPDASTAYYSGAIDLVVGIQVRALNDGTRLICVEENGAGKVMVYAWTPS